VSAVNARPDFTVGNIFFVSARRAPNRLCLVGPDGTGRTYSQVAERVNRIANALRARGLAKGDRLAVLATDSPEYVELMLASFVSGIVFIPLNYRLAADELRLLLEKAEPAVLFVESRYHDTITSISATLTAVPQLYSLDGSLPDDVTTLLAEGSAAAPPFVPMSDDDTVSIMFTSGTTGLPKGVVQSHRMLKSVAGQMWETLPAPDEVRYTASPLFHAAGLFVLICHLSVGCTSLILPQFDADQVGECIASGMLSGCFLVPTMIAALLEREDHDTSRERITNLMYGGAPMPPALLRRALDRWPDCNFWNMFGSGTESNAQAFLRPADHRRALAGEEHLLESVGQPIMGVDLRVLDDTGNEVPTGVTGHIAARTDVVMSGYLDDDPEASRDALHDGWFFSGDMGWFDAEGYLFLAGRSRDMIIRGGENIYVAEVERVLSSHPAVVDAAVVGRPDERWGELPVAFVEVRAEAAPTEDELRALCRERLAAYKVPVEFQLLTALPRNATGKALKEELRRRAGTTVPV
jgi:acyl-CoA synthetase (AMP-forming)/AMP-acid ligase II